MFVATFLILTIIGAFSVNKIITEEIYENPSKAKQAIIGLTIIAVFLLGVWEIDNNFEEVKASAYEQGYQEGKSEGYSEGYRDGQNDPYFG